MNIFETLGPKLRKAILLTESNRAMREMLKGNIHPMALQRKGLLRPAERMERGYLKGVENKRAKHGIRDLDYAEQHVMGLPHDNPGYAIDRRSLADHTTDADTPKRVRKAARKFLRNNPNDKGWTHTLPGNESVVRGHETDELLSKAKSHATIGTQKRGDKQPMQIGNHRGLDVLGKEMQDTARLKAHGSSMGDKVVMRPERNIAQRDNTLKTIPARSTSLQGVRYKTGEYDLVRRKAGMDSKSSLVGPREMRKLRNARHDVLGAFLSQSPERPVVNEPMARKAAKMKRRQLRAVSKGLSSKYGDKFMKMRGDNPHRFKGNAASMMVNKTFGNISESAVARAGNLQEALSEQTRAMIPKNKFATPTMERVGHADKGLYPIFDKTSAKSALKLSSKHPHLKREITRRAAVYGVKPEVKKDPWGNPKAGIAQEIAKDHLAEFPDYYTRLRKMEHKAARAMHGKRGGKMRELKHEITESIIRRGILMEGAWDRMKGMLSKAGAAVKKHSPALARDAAQSPLELASLVEPTGFLRGAYQGPVPKRFRDSSKMDQLKKHIGVGSNTTVHNRPPEFGEHPLGHMMHQGMKYKRDLLDKVTPKALKKRAMRMFDRGNNNAIMVPSAKDKTSVGFSDKPDKFDVFPLGHKPLDMATASHELGHAKEHGKMSFGTALVKRKTDAGTLYDEIQATRRGIRGLKHLGRAEGRPVARRELRHLMRANRSYAVQTLANKAREIRGKLKVDPSY